MKKELLQDYLDYCEIKNRRDENINYLVSDIKDTYFSSDRTWFYPLIIHNKYKEWIASHNKLVSKEKKSTATQLTFKDRDF